jgi:hypothetical protein
MCSEMSVSTTLLVLLADVSLLAMLQVMSGDQRKMMYLANPENGKKVVSAAGPAVLCRSTFVGTLRLCCRAGKQRARCRLGQVKTATHVSRDTYRQDAA